MLANQLLTTTYPTLNLYDKVFFALQLMEDFEILHLPVLTDDKFIGLVSKENLLNADENLVLQTLEDDFLKGVIKENEHFFSAIRLSANNSLSLVPVVNENLNWIGAITLPTLIKATSSFMGTNEPGALVVLEMERKNYSFGEISRLVETNDAYITQFNTSIEDDTGMFLVTIKLNKIEISDIIATFQRYEYNIRYFIGEEEYQNELRYNYAHLMSYLKV